MPFQFTKIGRWWHKDKEIDLVGISEKAREIGFFEVELKSLSKRESLRVLTELKERSKFVD